MRVCVCACVWISFSLSPCSHPISQVQVNPVSGKDRVHDCQALASLRQSRESDILDVLETALAEEPEEIFKRAGKSGGELSFEDVKRVFGNEHNEEVLKVLFADFDTDQNGHVSIDELKMGLKHLKIMMAEHDSLKGVVDAVDVGKIFSRVLAQSVRKRRHASEPTVPIDDPINVDDLAKYLQETDLDEALQSFVRAVRDPLTRELDLIKSQAQATVQETNTKFVPGTFEGSFGNMSDFRSGVTAKVGLPASNLWKGMELECCGCVDSDEKFSVSNNGRYSTTKQDEWNHVVNPEMGKEYPGGRVGVKLDVFLVGHGAQRRNGGETLDMPLDETDERLIEVAKKNDCSATDMIDAVKGTLLRKAKSLMTVDALDLAIVTVKSEEEEAVKKADVAVRKADNANIIKGLEELKQIGAHKLEKLRKELADALKEAPRVTSVGEISFSAVATKMQHGMSQNVMKALALYARRILMAAKVCEEEVCNF